MQIRLECTLPELPNNWVDLADGWTRREVGDWMGGQPEKVYPLMQRKIIGCHVYRPDGDLIEDAETLVASLDDLDVRLVRWIGPAITAALVELMALGEARRRLLFDGAEVVQRM